MLPYQSISFNSPLLRGVSHCIYCDGEGTTNDHLVPQGLGGVHYLRNGCCEAHRDQLNRQIDGPVLRHSLRALRRAANMPFTSEDTGKVSSVCWFTEAQRGGRLVEKSVPYDDNPRMFALPIFKRPALVDGRVTEADKYFMKSIAVHDGGEYLRRVRAVSTDGLAMISSVDIDVYAFARMICKIAHAAIYYMLPRGSFQPLLRDIVLGADRDIFRYFGSVPRPVLPDPQGEHYNLSLASQGKFVFICVQLFKKLGYPPYEIVAGLLPFMR